MERCQREENAIILVMGILFMGAIGMFVLAYRVHKQTSSVMERLANQLGIGKQVARFGTDAKYLGGHPSHPATGSLVLSLRERGFVMAAGGKASANYYSNVSDVSVMSQDQIQKDVTLTRLLTLGVFAFAAKKTTVTHQQFVRITLNTQGISSNVLIQSSQAGRIASLMNQGRILVAQHAT